ncbi:MAG: polysaccharide deacetylase 2 family uncharacterized protein YibQ [Candidatus Azotimanducaceae bacterium]|jgi:polysaccharide deacetylase 2 family uncharacterized protein YibQ
MGVTQDIVKNKQNRLRVLRCGRSLLHGYKPVFITGFLTGFLTTSLLCAGLLATTTTVNAETITAKLAIVIDDVGYSKARGLDAINLPGQVTLAVLPFAPHTQNLIKIATAKNREMIIHQPMEPHASAHARIEKDTLTLAMAPLAFSSTLDRALAAVPQRLGLSNHTGSLLTAHYPPMLQLMRRLKQRDLFFLDSRTTTQTVAMRAADEVGVIALQRDVFLDNVRTTEAIHLSFEKAVRTARRQGSAILIGHPYPVTLDYLQSRLRNLPADVQLVRLSELARQRRAMLAQAQHPASPHISLGQ